MHGQKNYSSKLKKKIRSTEIKKDIFKTLAYPILGNLPGEAQKFLEEKLGKENYDAIDACEASMFTNLFVYSALTYNSITYFETEPTPNLLKMFFAGLIGLVYGVPEAAMRDENVSEKRPYASLIGKIVSLPIEIPLSLYEKAREYRNSLEGRIDEEVKAEINRTEKMELELREKIIRPLYSDEEMVKRNEIYEGALKNEQKDFIRRLYAKALEEKDFDGAKKLAKKLGIEEKIGVAKAEHEYLGALIDYQALPFEFQKSEVEPYLTQFLYNGGHSAGRKIEEEDVKILDIDKAGSKPKENA